MLRFACCALLGASALVACTDDGESTGSGQQLVYVESTGTGGGRLVRVAADGSHRTVLYDGGPIGQLSVGPDGSILFLVVEQWLLLAPGGGTATPFTPPDPYAGFPVWSPDGDLIAWRVPTEGGLALGVAAPGSTSMTRITGDSLIAIDPAWSPDGERLVFAARNDARDTQNLYTVRRDGSGLQKITGDSLRVFQPADWSSAGDRIVFAIGDIWTVAPDGTGLHQVTTDGAFDGPDAFTGEVFWSPDDVYVMVAGDRDGWMYRVRVDTGAQENLHHFFPGTDPFSPDARRLIAMGLTPPDNTGDRLPAVLVLTPDGTQSWQVSSDTLSAPAAAWLHVGN